MRGLRLAGLVLCLGSASLAHGKMPAADTVKGAKDHPLLSRFEGAKLVGYDVKEFDEAMLPAGKRIYDSKARRASFEKSFQLEGKVTRIAYVVPRERSTLEVMRNYEAALAKAGLKTAFACVKDTCGDDIGDYWWDKRLSNGFIKGDIRRASSSQGPARDATWWRKASVRMARRSMSPCWRCLLTRMTKAASTSRSSKAKPWKPARLPPA